MPGFIRPVTCLLSFLSALLTPLLRVDNPTSRGSNRYSSFNGFLHYQHYTIHNIIKQIIQLHYYIIIILLFLSQPLTLWLFFYLLLLLLFLLLLSLFLLFLTTSIEASYRIIHHITSIFLKTTLPQYD